MFDNHDLDDGGYCTPAEQYRRERNEAEPACRRVLNQSEFNLETGDYSEVTR